jgi:ubiquinone/menaquinone biosynthesis C-methylase UbiE
MVSIQATSKKYRGRKAETYDEIRTRQQRWTLENKAVEQMLDGMQGRTVLDCPVGTGRFLSLYWRMGMLPTGADISDEMLALARKKLRGPEQRRLTTLAHVSATELALACSENVLLSRKGYDVAVCVRFLDLIDEEAMRRVMIQLFQVTRERVILTIRLGDEYVPKSNTATHDRLAFNRLVKSRGWCVEESRPIFDAGWTVMQLGRKK